MGKNGPKNKISSDFLEHLHTSQFENAEYKFDIDILKSIFGQIGPKNKTSSDLLENLRSRYFEGAEYKSDITSYDFLFKT